MYPVGLVTPVVPPVDAPAPPVVIPVVEPVVVPVVEVPAAFPFVVIVGVDAPPILPKIPNPNNNPKIKASKAKIPSNGHNQLGHPSFLVLVLVSLIGSDTVAATRDPLTYGTVSTLGC